VEEGVEKCAYPFFPILLQLCGDVIIYEKRPKSIPPFFVHKSKAFAVVLNGVEDVCM
jgi:hypothetical protein